MEILNRTVGSFTATYHSTVDGGTLWSVTPGTPDTYIFTQGASVTEWFWDIQMGGESVDAYEPNGPSQYHTSIQALEGALARMGSPYFRQ